ncbi:MAG TPA: hypothetical protein VMG12_29155 [Polyangiaceae bacterium]|nr:hypothetical protein [Polyangiaceae bacterium]
MRRHWLLSGAGVLLFGTGCPQLLDDHFAEHDSTLSQPDAAAAGSCGGGVCASGGTGGSDAAGRGGSSNSSGGTGSSGGGGSGAGGSGAAGGNGGSGAGGSGGSNASGSGGGGSGGSGLGGTSGLGGSGGTGSSGSGGTGTIAEVRACPFGEPEPLVGLDFASGSEFGPSLTADGLTLYFAQGLSGDGDLYRATRPDRGVTFSTPVALTNINTNDDEGTPFISADGLRLYYYSTRAGGPGLKDIYVATRTSTAVEFPSGQMLANVNSTALDHLPRLSPDELTIWFTSTRAGGAGGADLWTSTRASIASPFAAPTLLDAVNGSSGDESGGMTQDRLGLVFDSTRDGVGNSEIFLTTRASTGVAFASPTNLSVVNSELNEYNVFLTLDERELFFSSNRSAGSTHHLFRSIRQCN